MAEDVHDADQRLSRAGLVRYIDYLNNGLDEIGVGTQQRFLMQSNGGVMPFATAIAAARRRIPALRTRGRRPSQCLSGAGAGQIRARHPRHGGDERRHCLIEGGVPLEVTEGTIARRQIDVPSLDMTTISAAEGRLPGSTMQDFSTWVAEFRRGSRPRLLRARHVAHGDGCRPGLWLPESGILSWWLAEARCCRFPEGAPDQDWRSAEYDRARAASGIRRIVDTRMADEVRVFAAKRGVDLSAFTLLPFGGAGAVHAAAVAEELGMRRILVPARPGAFSALGLLCTDVVHDYIRSELKPLDAVTPEHVEEIYGQLQAKAHAELFAEGMRAADARFFREIDLRYAGQGYELRTPLDGLFIERVTAESLAAAGRVSTSAMPRFMAMRPGTGR